MLQKLKNVFYAVVAVWMAIIGGLVLHQQTAPKFASAPGFVGTQIMNGGANARHEGFTNPVRLAPNACATIHTIPIPLGASGGGQYWFDVFFNSDNIDAAVNCDSGVCTSHQESKIAVDIHGGQCCIMGGAVCSSDGGGGLSSYAANDTPLASSAPNYGVQSQIICNAAAQTMSGVACAGPNTSTWVSGLVSEAQISTIGLLDSSIVDSGAVDAADAADASDSGDAGTPPTLSLIAPNECLATGTANTIALTGTTFLTGMTFDYASLTANTATIGSSTSATVACPTYSSANGTSTLQATTLCNGAACVNGPAAEYTGVGVIPTNMSLVGWISGDGPNTVVSTHVTVAHDMSPGATNFTGGGGGPVVNTSFFGGLTAWTYTGSALFLGRTTKITSNQNAQCAVFKTPASWSSDLAISEMGDNGVAWPLLLLDVSGNKVAFTDTITGSTQQVVAANTTYFACGVEFGTTYTLYLGSGGSVTSSSGTFSALASFGGGDNVGFTGLSSFNYVGTIAEVLMYQGSLSSSDVTTLYHIECGASGGAGRWGCL